MVAMHARTIGLDLASDIFQIEAKCRRNEKGRAPSEVPSSLIAGALFGRDSNCKVPQRAIRVLLLKRYGRMKSEVIWKCSSIHEREAGPKTANLARKHEAWFEEPARFTVFPSSDRTSRKLIADIGILA